MMRLVLALVATSHALAPRTWPANARAPVDRRAALDVSAWAGVAALGSALTGFAQPAEAADAQYEKYLAAKAKRDAARARSNPRLEYAKPGEATDGSMATLDTEVAARIQGRAAGGSFGKSAGDKGRGDKTAKLSPKRVLKDDTRSLKEMAAEPSRFANIRGRERGDDGTGEYMSSADRAAAKAKRIQSGEYAAEMFGAK